VTFGGDADTFRKVIDTLIQCEIVATKQLSRGGVSYVLV